MNEHPTDQQVVEVDAREVITAIEQTHPDVVARAVWQVRALRAESRIAELESGRGKGE